MNSVIERIKSWFKKNKISYALFLPWILALAFVIIAVSRFFKAFG